MMSVADYWWWLSAGVVLMVLEIVTPGIFFIWIGIGAFITGAVAAAFPSASASVLGFVFAILSVISVFVGKRVMGRKTDEQDSGLNNRMAQYVGQVYQVYEPIMDGRGKISVGDRAHTRQGTRHQRAPLAHQQRRVFRRLPTGEIAERKTSVAGRI